MGNTFRIPWTNRRSWISNRAARCGSEVRFRHGAVRRCPPWGTAAALRGGGGGAKRPQSRGLWPRLWFGRRGAEGPRPPNAAAPPQGVPGIAAPRVQRRGEGGTVQPILAPEPLGLAGALATYRRRRDGLTPGPWEPLRPCGGAAGAQSAHKAGALGAGFGSAARGPKGTPGRANAVAALPYMPPEIAADEGLAKGARVGAVRRGFSGKRKRPRNRGLCCFY